MKKIFQRNRKLKPFKKETYSLRFKSDATFVVDGVERCLYNDVDLFKYLLKYGYLSYSHLMSENFSFVEVIMSSENVSEEVLDFLVSYAKRHFKKLNPEEYIGLVDNEKVLEWMFKRGYKCKHYKGHGNSTMEALLRHSFIPNSRIVELLVKYDAADKEYLKSKECDDRIKEICYLQSLYC